MYSHHINEMVEAVMVSFGYAVPVNKDEKEVQEVQDIDRLKIHKALEKYWSDKIAISWSIEDVIQRAKDIGKGKISKQKARDILDEVLHRHDCSIGVNWDVIDNEIIEQT